MLGANGAGKSTLLRLLVNLLNPHQGEINCYGEYESLSYLGHDLQLYLDLTVSQNLAFFTSLWGGDCDDAMQYWSLLEYKDRAVKTLSQGQKKRVALAVSYLTTPHLSLLDEPSSNLDVLGANLLKEKLLQCGNHNACIVASHNLRFFADWCNRVLVIDDCLISQYEGLSPEEIKEIYLKVLR